MSTVTMAKKSTKIVPKALELSAGQLVALLVDEAGESLGSINRTTGITPAALSRFRSEQRVANENDYRQLASMAISLKIAE